MSVVRGLHLSFHHNQNGMTEADMLAAEAAAKNLNEVIIFRSTGPWAKRWLEKNYPSKNFHVKGKSSDWGPHAGLVPYDGTWSKVGYDAEKARKGTEENDKGLHSGFAGRAPLVLTRAQIDEMERRPEGRPARTALTAVAPAANGTDLLLTARRSGDALQVAFLAQKRGDGRYDILVYPDRAGRGNGKGLVRNNVFLAQDRAAGGGAGSQPVPLEVMTSEEVGANRQPMTGDYDLMAVCPTWADYGSRAPHDIAKAAIALNNGVSHRGQAFAAGVGMDNVLDGRLATGGTRGTDYAIRAERYRKNFWAKGRNAETHPDLYKLIFQASPFGEHGDMGNLTPRILRCINTLNVLMGARAEKAALRRVHHNAESHRYRAFGALTERDMLTVKEGDSYGDGFPLTVFQPSRVVETDQPAAWYGTVCTLETLEEFRTYASVLAASGYYVPRSWVWNMQFQRPRLAL